MMKRYKPTVNNRVEIDDTSPIGLVCKQFKWKNSEDVMTSLKTQPVDPNITMMAYTTFIHSELEASADCLTNFKTFLALIKPKVDKSFFDLSVSVLIVPYIESGEYATVLSLEAAVGSLDYVDQVPPFSIQ